MTEQTVLRGILNDRATFNAFRDYGDSESLSPAGRLLVRFASEYYGADPDVQCCDDAVILERAARQLSNPKHAALLKRTIESLPTTVSKGNARYDILDHKRRGIGNRVAMALANGSPPDEIEALIASYQAVPKALEGPESTEEPVLDVLDTADLKAAQEAPEKLIELWPKDLNDRVDGGARRGHHILVFARPETGKTLFTINLCAGFLTQGYSVLYIGNEEPAEDLRTRFRMRLLGKGKQQIRQNPERVADALSKLNIGRLKIAALAPGTFAEVRRLVESYNADIVVLDQLRNMHTGNDSRTGQLEDAANAARTLAKGCNCLVVSLTQAGDSASGKIYLQMNDVDSSKTGIPAAADLMIGIGANDQMKASGLLGISLPKNKLSGRHDQFTVSCNLVTGVVS